MRPIAPYPVPRTRQDPMKTDIHPDYHAVVFRDLGTGDTFLTRSTVTSDKRIELDGVEYPVVDVEISSASHPFYGPRLPHSSALRAGRPARKSSVLRTRSTFCASMPSRSSRRIGSSRRTARRPAECGRQTAARV